LTWNFVDPGGLWSMPQFGLGQKHHLVYALSLWSTEGAGVFLRGPVLMGATESLPTFVLRLSNSE
jgi:hypothetical protein